MPIIKYTAFDGDPKKNHKNREKALTPASFFQIKISIVKAICAEITMAELHKVKFCEIFQGQQQRAEWLLSDSHTKRRAFELKLVVGDGTPEDILNQLKTGMNHISKAQKCRIRLFPLHAKKLLPNGNFCHVNPENGNSMSMLFAIPFSRRHPLFGHAVTISYHLKQPLPFSQRFYNTTSGKENQIIAALLKSA